MNRVALPVTIVIVLGIVHLGIAWGEPASDPAAIHGQRVGSALYCDDGYYRDGARCAGLPKVANGSYLGSTLYCDDGHYKEGTKCLRLPGVVHGGYLGSTLYCHDGYYQGGGRCIPLPGVVNGGYLGVTLYCDDGYYTDGAQCVQLPAVENGALVGNVRVCNDGFEIQGDLCVKSSDPADVWKRFDAATLARSRFAPAPVGLYDMFVEVPPAILKDRPSGSRLDAKSGLSYRWDRAADGSTTLYGMKFSTKSSWRATIQPDGSMRGLDKTSSVWRYHSSSGVYLNLGTGKVCVGKGAAPACY